MYAFIDALLKKRCHSVLQCACLHEFHMGSGFCPVWVQLCLHILEDGFEENFRCIVLMGTSIRQVLLFLWLGIMHTQAGGADPNTTAAAGEMQALFILRESLQVQGDTWPSNTNPCNSWAGIACEEGHVILISLASIGFPLQGVFPTSFGKLTQLNVLDLTGTSLHGTVPASLSLLSNLKFLSLAENNLTGPISPAVDGLFNLQHFDISYNGFTGSLPFTFFSRASQLVYVDVSHNTFENRIPPYVGQLVHLQHLALGHNLLQGSLPLKHLNWSRLRYLDVSNNDLWGSIADGISHLKSLFYLNLQHNYFTGTIPSAISNCTQLQALLLDHNVLSNGLPLSLATLTNLVTLSLSFNNLSGHIPSTIFTLPKLTSLTLSHNLFFGPLVFEELKHKQMQSFDISYNFLQGDVPIVPFSVEGMAKNCFHDVPNQHTLKACRQFYSRNVISWHGTPPESVLPSGTISPHTIRGRAHKSKRLIIILGCGTGGAFLLVIAGACALCYEKYNQVLDIEMNGQMGEADSARGSSMDKGLQLTNSSFLGEMFSYEILHRATGGFSSLQMLANGQSGEFYKGTLDGGTKVVVKRVYTSKMMELYLKELEIFGRVFHRRLITILGYCVSSPEEKFLVYKFMPFGDLATVMQRKESHKDEVFLCPQTHLDWITRLKIAVGVAEGLAYLHHECSPPVVHGNIKASSILLDEKFEVRLGSLSGARTEGSHPRLISCLLGISQSLDPVDQDLGITGRSKDVYDFGKLLLEVMSGKSGITERRDFQTDSWMEWAVSLINVHDKEALYQILDPSLILGGDFLDEAMVMAIVAKACVNVKVSKRPNMRHALKALKNPTFLFQEEKAQSRLSRILSQRSWNTALFGAFRSVGASSSISASENLNETISTAENSTFLVQNPSYISEIEELSLSEIEEV